MTNKYKALYFGDLRDWGIALCMLVSLSGCGADVSNGQGLVSDTLSATDSSELHPEAEKKHNKEVLSIMAPAPVARQPELPSGNILDNLSKTDSLRQFLNIVRRSDMVKKLNGTGPYTVFAPSDVAFKSMYGLSVKDLLKPENRSSLQKLVNTHLIAGKLTVADLEDGATLITTGGHQLKVSKKKGEVRINNALVALPDGACLNGVVHVVDRVLEPTAQK